MKEKPFGTRVADRYVLGRSVGQGGMATVYLAHDTLLDHPVALKMLRHELAHSAALERFTREIGVISSLRHVHIVPLHDSGIHDGLPFYVMPYIDGESLKDRLEREHALAPAEVARIGAEVAEALAYAHREGVLHRDITPANILLGDAHAYIADFGIARVFQETGRARTTASGFVLGTPAYMSPEQASGELDYDGRSDIYSLGCVLYEACAGAAPFQGPTPQAVIAARFGPAPPPLDTVRTGVSSTLGNAIARAMALAPDDRFPDAAAFAAELRADCVTMENSPVSVRHPLIPEQTMTDQSTPQHEAGYESATGAPPTKAPSYWEDFIDIFYAPSEVFRRREHSGFGVPMVVLTLLIGTLLIVMSGAMQPIIDAEFARNMAVMLRKNPGLTPEMMEKGRSIGETLTKIGAFIFLPVGMFFVGLALWVCGKLFDAKQTLAAAIMVAAYSFTPRLVEALLKAVQALFMDPASLNGQFRISLSPARFLDPDTASPVLIGLLSRVDVFTIWVTVLLAIGLSVTGRIPRGKAAIAAGLVWLLGALPVMLAALRSS